MNETLKVSLKNRSSELKKCPHCKKKPDFATWSDGRMEIQCTDCSETILENRPYSVIYYHAKDKDFHYIMNKTVWFWNSQCNYISKTIKEAKSAS